MRKIKAFLAIASLGGLLTAGVFFTFHQSAPLKSKAALCDSHEGYHYERKEPTETESGHKEFWTCCKCHEQFLEEPEGHFIDVDDSNMTGGIDINHIAYLAPTGNIEVASEEDSDSWGDINWF